MSRQRMILFFLLTLIFVAVSILYFSRVWDESRTRFRTGLPIPENILPDELRTLRGLVPDGPPQAPDIRPSDPLLSGSVESPVTIIVFGDFECEYCKDQAIALEDAMQRINRPKDIRIVWRDLPLVNQHARAMSAAVVGRCAHAQGEFKLMHDLLFAKAQAFHETEYLGFARQLHLNDKVFLTCLRDPAHVFRINQDIEEAQSLAITEVPIMFINGQPITGFVDADALDIILSRELERSTSPS